MATPVPLEPAFVLHRHPYRETSLLLEVFARDSGRMGLVARGGRGRRRDRAVLLQPFSELLIGWRGRGDLGSLTQSESRGPALPLTGRALFAGFYVNELLLRMLRRHDAAPGIYDDYREVLAELAAGGLEAALRRFEKRLLEQCGYGLQLHEEADSGEPVDPERRYGYLPEHGPVPEGGGGTPVLGRTLLDLADERFDDPQTLREAKRLMRAVLEQQLGPKPLRSRELFTTRSAASGGILPPFSGDNHERE